jgi:hypothetical protein
MLNAHSSEEFVNRVKGIEHRADQCIDHLALLTAPSYLARWTILSAAIHLIEENYKAHGPDSAQFKAAMINLGRHAPMLIRWLDRGSQTDVPSNWEPHWESFVGGQAFRDLRVTANYDAFLLSYPMWYQNRLSAELIGDDVVRFCTPPHTRDRQVSAFQKGLRKRTDAHQAMPGTQIVPTDAIKRRYMRILSEAVPKGERGFQYEHPYELARRTFLKYSVRMDQIMRRSEDLNLGPYTLGTFKRFYAALQSVCAIHDHLCFLWELRSGAYPIESAVQVKTRDEWIKILSFHSDLGKATTEQLLSDLTFHSKRLPDLHVFPFVPLDEAKKTLALAPQFILGSAPEDNILRTCSYLRESSYSLLSNDKAEVMRRDIIETLKDFRCEHSILLPNGSTDVDLLVEDVRSSSVVIAELKWYRKPSTYRERLRVDADFEDGFNRQLTAIREYCQEHPDWLRQRGLLTRSLSDYESVVFLLIGRDYWSWFDRLDNTAVVEFEQFRLALGRSGSLRGAVQELLSYDWLPVEDEDFHVQFDRGLVEGVGVESEVYYAGPPTRRGRF